ncbi:response regulator [bacterium]|nr:response regulator [bacterium]MBU1651041.1 response regulator [bacterium]MBU1881171.1 response regulator [bacterium]
MKKILVIDDDPTIVNLLCEVLASEDRVIRRAGDGTTAMNWLEKETFHLIISDLMMPGPHGYQIVETIKSNPDLRSAKTILLTAKAYKRDEEKAKQIGTDIFMTKPFKIEELRATVDKLLSE